jgi:hypothetical protein
VAASLALLVQQEENSLASSWNPLGVRASQRSKLPGLSRALSLPCSALTLLSLSPATSCLSVNPSVSCLSCFHLLSITQKSSVNSEAFAVGSEILMVRAPIGESIPLNPPFSWPKLPVTVWGSRHF